MTDKEEGSLKTTITITIAFAVLAGLIPGAGLKKQKQGHDDNKT